MTLGSVPASGPIPPSAGPDDTDDLDYFYPTAVMETGYDILFFWVARMIMLGIENMGHEPFHTIYLHGLIRDANGAKMSKSRGNAMDPLLLVDQYGTDALRFALTTGTSPGNDLRLTDGKLEASRNFANKLWNASRFVLVSLEGANQSNGQPSTLNPTHREDRWIMSRLNRVAEAVNSYLHHFELGEAQRELYDFIWHEYCDWYIELAKLRLRNDDGESPLPVLAHVLEQTLRLLHPFMPFITEEIWQRLKPHVPGTAQLPASIMVSGYPKSDPSGIDPAPETEMNLVQDIITQVRNYRAEEKIPAGQQVEATVAIDISVEHGATAATSFHEAVSSEAPAVKGLARVSGLTVVQPGAPSPDADTTQYALLRAGGAEAHGFASARIWLPLADTKLQGQDRTKLEKELADLLKQIDRLTGQLSNEDFRSKAPAEVRERMENQRQAHLTRKEQLEDLLAQMG